MTDVESVTTARGSVSALTTGNWSTEPYFRTSLREKLARVGAVIELRTWPMGPPYKTCGLKKAPKPERMTVFPALSALYAKPIRGEALDHWLSQLVPGGR